MFPESSPEKDVGNKALLPTFDINLLEIIVQ